MLVDVTTSLDLNPDVMNAAIIGKWLNSLPTDAKIEFVIQAEQDDRFHYTPAKVKTIKATWKQDFSC